MLLQALMLLGVALVFLGMAVLFAQDALQEDSEADREMAQFFASRRVETDDNWRQMLDTYKWCPRADPVTPWCSSASCVGPDCDKRLEEQ